jgi:hypothetical protein
MRSDRVVFPESMWALMPIFRIREISKLIQNVPLLKKFSLPVCKKGKVFYSLVKYSKERKKMQ